MSGGITKWVVIPQVMVIVLGANAQEKPEVYVQLGHRDVVNSVAFSADGKLLASGSRDNNIKLWDAATGREIRTLQGHSSYVLSVAFSADGKLLASGSGDNTITLWEVATGREIRTLKGHSSVVNSVAFSADGKLLASGSYDKTITLWEVATGKAIRTLQGHRGNVYSVAFSADGKLLASGSWDGSTRLWNVQTGKEIALCVSFTDREWVVTTPEGYYDTSANGDKNLNVRIGNSVYGIENYRATFMRPDLVQAALSGK